MSESKTKDPDAVAESGVDPTEEVGPAGAEAGPEDCQQRTIAAGEPPQDSEWPLSSEVHDAFDIEPIPMAPHPQDGMPVPIDETASFAFAAPFAYDTVCCIEDDRAFVEVFQSERAIDIPHELVQMLGGELDAYLSDGSPRPRRRFQPDEVKVRWGHRVAWVPTETGAQSWVTVRPQRERCIHYKRQVFANDDLPDPQAFGHKIVYRNCGARRSVGGALMSLRDEAIYACDYRVPADPKTTERFLDTPDRARLEQSAHRTFLPMFGLE